MKKAIRVDLILAAHPLRQPVTVGRQPAYQILPFGLSKVNGDLSNSFEFMTPEDTPLLSPPVCRDSGDLLADNQQMHVMGTFIGVDRLKVVGVAHDRILPHDAVGP